MTRRRAAELLDVSAATIDRWISAGELRALRRQGYTRIYRSSVEEFEQRHAVKPAASSGSAMRPQLQAKRTVIEPKSASAMVAEHLAKGRSKQ